jgi:hypothetical protein
VVELVAEELWRLERWRERGRENGRKKMGRRRLVFCDF